MNFPENLKYTKEHIWVKVEADTATVGATDEAQKQLNDVVFVELPEAGKQVKQGDTLATIESVKSVTDVPSPLSCEVLETNEELNNNPELINSDCYGKGWIVKVKIIDEKQVEGLLSNTQYQDILGKK